MIRALLITGAVVVALVVVLAGVGKPARWPAAETPPQQGEAAIAAVGGALPVHAPAALARLVREPQNTWSNLAFVWVGALMIASAGRRLRRCVGVTVIAVGIGSFLYHASVARALRQLDVAAMFWVFLMMGFLCAAALAPRWREWIEQRAGLWLGVTLLAAVGLTVLRNVVVAGGKPFSLRVAAAIAAATIILSIAQVARRRETVGAALQMLGIVTLFGVAVGLQTVDRPGGRWFRPDAWLQAHAVWHVLAAAALGWAARFLAVEEKFAETPASGPASEA